MLGMDTKKELMQEEQEELILKDGSSILVRPITEDDVAAWMAFVGRLGDKAVWMNFHHDDPTKMDSEDAVRFCRIDHKNTFALVAEVLRGKQRDIVGIGCYYRIHCKRSAEIALAIEDSYRGKGLGTGILEKLAQSALSNDIAMFEADVPRENQKMMDVLRDYGFHTTADLEGGIYHVTFPLGPTRRVLKREEERERTATLASLTSILWPRSVAVIGASRQAGSIGQILLECIVKSGYTGTVYPVNPQAKSILSIRTYPSILDISDDIELAVIVVPAQFVARVTDECGRKGVKALVVISDGFKESGPEGAAREKELREIALGHGMRIIGPNCMGIINTDPALALNATFSPIYPPHGNVAFLSQSGAMGLVILAHANDLNLGISTFVSAGNRADISANDLLQYWEADPQTGVILLYLESFGNTRKFGRIARRVSKKKPIVVVKSGSTPAGSRAASSHTGALATSDVTSEILFRHAGIIRANTMEELFDVAALLSNQPLPRGRRLVIVTNGGGPGIIAADASERNRLELPDLSEELVSKLRAVIRRDITLRNPLDTTAGATADEFEGVLRILASDSGNDAVLAIFIPPTAPAGQEHTARAIRRVAPLFQHHGKPLLVCFLGERGFKTQLGPSGKLVPFYSFPEEAVLALTKAVEYAEMRRRPQGKVPKFRGIQRERARKIIETAMTRTHERPLWLSPQEIADVGNCYGMKLVETAVANTAAKAASAAKRMGFPVVVKLSSSTITHKTDVGGVILDLQSENKVKQAFANIKARLAKMGRAHEMQGVTVQPMVKEGIEAIVGMTHDPLFGPLIMFGAGGINVELIKDVAMRLHPLTDIDARELWRSIKMSKMLEGFRGTLPSDTQALEDLLLRLSALVEDLPQIAEIDFNPVKVLPQGRGYLIVDARVMLR
jgi:acetate---CoA ligase (ADP-forming)